MVNTRLRGKQKSKPRIWEASVIEKKKHNIYGRIKTDEWVIVKEMFLSLKIKMSQIRKL